MSQPVSPPSDMSQDRHQRKSSLRFDDFSKVVMNQPLNMHELLEKSSEELQFLISECKVILDELKTKVLSEYQYILPSLEKIKHWKQHIKVVKKKLDTYEHFFMIEENTEFLDNDNDNDDEKKTSFGKQKKTPPTSTSTSTTTLHRYPPHAIRSIQSMPRQDPNDIPHIPLPTPVAIAKPSGLKPLDTTFVSTPPVTPKVPQPIKSILKRQTN
jgi:hypothetical protein